MVILLIGHLVLDYLPYLSRLLTIYFLAALNPTFLLFYSCLASRFKFPPDLFNSALAQSKIFHRLLLCTYFPFQKTNHLLTYGSLSGGCPVSSILFCHAQIYIIITN